MSTFERINLIALYRDIRLDGMSMAYAHHVIEIIESAYAEIDRLTEEHKTQRAEIASYRKLAIEAVRDDITDMLNGTDAATDL